MELKEISEDMDRFENLIKMINFEYNQYFAGNKKNPPIVYEREINKLIRKYNLYQIVNTTYRFKFNNLVAKFLTFRDKWNRKMMEFEGAKKVISNSSNPLNDSTNIVNIPSYYNDIDNLPGNIDRSNLKETVDKKVEELKAKGYKNFDVSVEIVEGKLKLRIKQK